MNRHFVIVTGFAAALCAAVFLTPSAGAQEAVERDLAQPEATTSTARAQAGQLDPKTAGANIRAGQLIGMNIQNEQGKDVGEIQDIVIDAHTGRVRYAAITYGGFLGLGNKLFAVPFEAFKCRPAPNDPEEHVLVLNVTQEQLEGATGFDKGHWPDFADQEFTSALDQRYGIERRRHKRAGAGVDVRVTPGGVGVEVDVNRDPNRDREN